MPRYKLTIEYDGRPFCGWQYQVGFPTVQGELQKAVQAMTGQAILVEGSGRTDSGVHALGQVAHVDLPKAYPLHQITGALNYYLQENGISVLSAEEVDDRFHARFSAKGREYLYRIVNRRAPSALELGRSWHVKTPLNIEKMQEVAKILTGHHDFTSFRSIHCQAKNPERTIGFFEIEKEGDLVTARVGSKAFLHNQVRIMVGTAKLVGEGNWSVDDVKRALDARDRTKGGTTAPSEGLYFLRVNY